MIRALGALVLAAALAVGGVAPAAAQRAPSPEERRELVADEVRRLKEQVDEAAAHEADLLAELEVTRRIRSELDASVKELERRVEGAAAELDAAEEAFADAVRRHRRAEGQLRRARAKLDEARRTLERQAVSSFMHYGLDTSALDVLFQVRDLRELHEVAGFVSAVASAQADVVRSYQEVSQSTRDLEVQAERTRVEAAQQRDAIAEQHQAVTTAQAEKASALAEAEREEAREQELVAGAQDKRSDYETRLAQLREESDAIAAMLRARQAAEAAAPGPAAAAEDGSGSAPAATATPEPPSEAPAAQVAPPRAPAAPPPTRSPAAVTPARSSTLSWPLANPIVTSGFGYRVHPIYGTSRLHAGIDLRGSTGTPIFAAADGVVVSAGVRGGYGNTVIIDHGGSLATLYAHQSQIYVGTGAKVRRGQTIGAVGSTGQSTGPHLHFEVRVNGTPVDPRNYL